GQEFSYNGNVYINKFPSDPSPGKQYYYSVDNQSLKYTLCACLENIADQDGTTCISPCQCQQNTKCYIVNQP
ncbi:MAG: hypothetical protein NZL96_04075, partial [Patescibacteria group bacterium]|nr:hypothetical protein [Patescibacteria group bacterium]